MPRAANGTGANAGTDVARPATCCAGPGGCGSGSGAGTDIKTRKILVKLKQIVQYDVWFIFHVIQTLRGGGKGCPERKSQFSEVTAL